MHTQLEKLVGICERAEARVRRKLIAARAYEAECRQRAARANACLDHMQHELQMVNREIVASDGLALHRFQSIQAYLDEVQDQLDRLRGNARKSHDALAVAEHERSVCAQRLLTTSVKLENARLRELQWCCQRSAISASQQEEYSIESWFQRQR